MIVLKKKIETSKIIVLATGLIFAVVIAVCLYLFIYCTIYSVYFDWTGIVTLLTISGTVFSTAIATYESKAKAENINKIKRSFLREKYDILKEMGVLDYGRAQAEIENEISNIDYKLETEEEATSETMYQHAI